MKVKELKELLNDVPDNYIVGYTENEEICDNWSGSYKEEKFIDDLHLSCNIAEKQLSLFIIRN